MQIKLSYLATNTFNGFILNINNKTYVINMFEGFQRYCTEHAISIGGFDVLLSTNLSNLNGILGWLLTLQESNVETGVLVANYKADFNILALPVPRFNFLQNIRTTYCDEYIKVKLNKVGSITNYHIEMPIVPGSFLPHTLPMNFPKKMIKNLKANETVVFKGEPIDGSTLCEDDVVIGNAMFIFSEEINDETIQLCTKSAFIFCMNQVSYDICQLKHFKGDTFKCVKNTSVEFVKQYERLQSVKSTILPIATGNLRENNTISDCDYFKYSKKERQLVLTKHTKQMVNTVPNRFSANYFLFLGTGSAIPSKLRTVSSFIYHNNGSSVLMDCGEDTLGQIKRAYGNLDILESIKVIYLSHSHADHILGVPAILKEIKHRVTIIGSAVSKGYIEIFNTDHEFIQIEGHAIELDNLKFRFLKSEHSHDSYFVAIEHENLTFSYSGDCRPSDEFARMSNGCDFMIHEATFEDKDIELAIKRKHATDVEAFRVFEASGAKNLILTHFSQRSEVAYENLKPNVFRAYDFYMHEIS